MIITHNVDVDFTIDEFDVLDWLNCENFANIGSHEMDMIYDSCCELYQLYHKTTAVQRIQKDLDQLSEEEQKQIFRNLRRKYPINHDEL